MKKKRSRFGALASLEVAISIGTALLAAGATYGSLNARVNSLETRPDPTPQVAALQTSLDDVKRDLRDIKNLLLSRPR